MPRPYIRPTALAVLLWRDHLLAARYEHPRGTYYRPLGGGIDFGERAVDALYREIHEELGRAVELVDRLAVSENIFELDGEPGHQIMFEFVVRWPPGTEPVDLSPIAGAEANGEPLDARWLPLSEVFAGAYTLYPDGLADRVQHWVER
ncbi:MAG: NUDIX domain-containing protein [Chloroflexi bacterium]|nr:NUDIX domain-containing protein [Chloroflexota bacterium]MDA1146595.1 NUDIX domain-containing protein [Chloroflexota bacterium]